MIRFLYVFFILMTLLMPAINVEASEFSERVAELGEVKSIRVGKAGDHLRVVIDTSKEVDYSTMVLSEPSRIVINLSGAWLGKDVLRDQNVDSPFATRIRAAQYDKTTVRIVIETPVTKGKYDMFSLTGGASPYRVVLDLGKDAGSNGNVKASDGDESSASASKEDNSPKTQSEQESKESKDTQGTQETAGTKDVNDETAADEKPAADESAKQNDRQKTEKQDEKSEEIKTESTKKDETNKGEKEEEPLPEPVFSKGIKGKKIAIDAGHGGEDVGAIGTTGTYEKTITLNIAKEVKRLLEKAGAKVIMTRETDTEVSPKHKKATDIDELQARCDVANKAKADIFVSIHMDSFTSRDASGTTAYFYVKGTATSKRLASSIQSALVKEINTQSRGTKSCNFYVVRKTTMPATLIEVAFISNPKEERMMKSEKGVKKAAVGIVNGISNFFDAETADK